MRGPLRNIRPRCPSFGGWDSPNVEPGQRIGFVDDPQGVGSRLAGELLSQNDDIFLFGLVVGDGQTSPRYADASLDMIVSVGGTAQPAVGVPCSR
ncbi:MAG: hypothetical protein M3492_08415 [Actinomycetota bacterium]|nr:hypothetical protein [Actinomycetota bacterium]